METLNNNQQTTGLQTFFNDGINAGIRMKMIDGEIMVYSKRHLLRFRVTRC